MKLLNYEIFDGNVQDIKIDNHTLVSTINAHSYMIAQNDQPFEKALKASDILIPDGSSIVLAAKLILKKPLTKIAGFDLHQHLLEELNKSHGKCFYMGASEPTLLKIKTKISAEYPNIICQTYSPPFKDSFSTLENKTIIKAVNSFKPDVLFVGMTAPKQEKWLCDNQENLNFKLATPIGAVFDFYAGNINRPHKIFIDFHLEWLGRLIKEPRRLWRRSISSFQFLGVILVKAYQSK